MTTTSYLGYGTADLSAGALEGGPPYTVHGVAIGPGDHTITKSGEKIWTADALEAAAETLADDSTDLAGDGLAVVDHSESAGDVVGEVTKSGWDPNLGVVYEMEIDDEDLAQQIANGRLEVSPRALHKPDSELETNDDGVPVVGEDDLKRFVHLSIEQSGAAPSNFVDIGPADQFADLSADDVRSALGADVDDLADDDGDGPSGLERLAAELHLPGDDLSGPQTPSGRGASTGAAVTDLSRDMDPDTLAERLDEYDEPTLVETTDLNELHEDSERVDDLEDEVDDLEQDLEAVRETLGLDIEDLAEQSGMSEETLEELPFSDLVSVATRLGDSDDLTDLTADPQSGDPDGDGTPNGDGGDGFSVSDLSDDQQEELEAAVDRYEYWDGKNDTIAETEKETIVDLTGADDFDEVDLEEI